MAKRKSVDSSNTATVKANKRRRSTDKATTHTMPPGTAIQENLVKSNEVYASSFTKGDLALPPAKHYAVGELYTPSPYRRLCDRAMSTSHPAPLFNKYDKDSCLYTHSNMYGRTN